MYHDGLELFNIIFRYLISRGMYINKHDMTTCLTYIIDRANGNKRAYDMVIRIIDPTCKLTSDDDPWIGSADLRTLCYHSMFCRGNIAHYVDYVPLIYRIVRDKKYRALGRLYNTYGCRMEYIAQVLRDMRVSDKVIDVVDHAIRHSMYMSATARVSMRYHVGRLRDMDTIKYWIEKRDLWKTFSREQMQDIIRMIDPTYGYRVHVYLTGIMNNA